MEITTIITPYLRWRTLRGDSDQHRAKARLRLKKHLFGFLKTLDKCSVEDLTPALLREFQEDLAFRITPKGTLLSNPMRNLILQTVKSFCQWLYQENYLPTDLSKTIYYIKNAKRLPKNILEEKEILAILETPDLKMPVGFRDRVMMEILYGTGIRCGELRNLKVSQLDLEQGFAFIEQGKGRKDRVVPLGKGLCKMLNFYLKEIRPKLLICGEHEALIPSTQRKSSLSETRIQRYLQKYALKAGIQKRVFPHLFRHTCATHMTGNGAPIRCVQELLGHANVNSTQIYTHLTIKDLKKAHAKYHPRERMKNRDKDPRPGTLLASS